MKAGRRVSIKVDCGIAGARRLRLRTEVEPQMNVDIRNN